MNASGGPTVLVVDDDRSLRRLLEVMLRHGGFTPVVAGNAAEAFRLLVGPPPLRAAAAVLDARLPDEHGIDLAGRLVDAPATADLPICFLTGSIRDGHPPLAGIATLSKPCTLAELVTAVQGLLAGPRAAAADRHAALDRLRARLLL